MRRLYPIAVAALCILCTACSVVRKLPEGSYLVQKVTIEDDRNVPKKERITASELDRYVWQSPNKRFLGTNFYVWVYNQSNPDKDNWWNRFKRKIGEKPVVYDPALTLKSAENLKAYMESHGFFSSRVRYHVDTTSRRKRAIITYRTEQGPPSRYGKINYEFNDKFNAQSFVLIGVKLTVNSIPLLVIFPPFICILSFPYSAGKSCCTITFELLV